VNAPFPEVLFHIFGLPISDTVVTTLGVTVLLVGLALVALRFERARALLEITYEGLVTSIRNTVSVDVEPLVPLVLTLWVFIGATNLIGLVPGLKSPTGDLSLTAALATVAFFAGHVYAFSREGVSYMRHYLEPTPWLLPLNVISELSRTLALALRLFGNALSSNLIAAIAVYLAGLLLPIPLMALSLLTGLVQAYIFGILTLVFAASSVATIRSRSKGNET
jgi:F-type H+-transporting ATPase subunit a